uniref:Uncharacterized protein n=1 Tax=Romanomermis culicivorax TaxID=13658 RepID=A0A915HPK6_ROMCU
MFDDNLAGKFNQNGARDYLILERVISLRDFMMKQTPNSVERCKSSADDRSQHDISTKTDTKDGEEFLIYY